MRTIRKSSIDCLKRRKIFLERRLTSRGEAKGGDYDKEEIQALDTAIRYMEFILEHPAIKGIIDKEETYDNIINSAK